MTPHEWFTAGCTILLIEILVAIYAYLWHTAVKEDDAGIAIILTLITIVSLIAGVTWGAA